MGLKELVLLAVFLLPLLLLAYWIGWAVGYRYGVKQGTDLIDKYFPLHK
jgi:hypothetical protein